MRGLLYRSPDVLIDGVVWHVVVAKPRSGRVNVSYRFRRTEREMWQSSSRWPAGKLPKGLGHRFQHYRRSIKVAIAGADLLERAA